MKKIILGIIIGIICSGTISALTSNTFVLTESAYPIYANCNEIVFDNPVLDYNGTTYVPLREFCDRNQININFNVNPKFSDKPFTKLILPFIQGSIVEKTVPSDVRFFENEDKIFEQKLFSQYVSQPKIENAEQAVKMAATRIGKLSLYDSKVYDVVFFEKYNAWMVTFCRQNFSDLCLSISEWRISAIVNSDGQLLMEFYDYPLETPFTQEGMDIINGF